MHFLGLFHLDELICSIFKSADYVEFYRVFTLENFKEANSLF